MVTTTLQATRLRSPRYMTEHRRRARALTEEQVRKRFSTDGKDFSESLAAVLAGGRDDDHVNTADEREVDK